MNNYWALLALVLGAWAFIHAGVFFAIYLEERRYQRFRSKYRFGYIFDKPINIPNLPEGPAPGSRGVRDER